MLEILTGTGLATAAGLNAYIPLLVIGGLARWTSLIDTPAGWEWLSNGWVLTILAVLLVIDVVADKIPVVDSVYDVLQTVVRPVSGGIAFGAGAGSETTVVQDPGAFFTSGSWIPVAIGVLMALGVHATKATTRVALTATTGGALSPAVSTVEDASSVGLSFAAIVAPLLVLLALVAVVVVVVRWRRRSARRGRLAPGVTEGPGGDHSPPGPSG